MRAAGGAGGASRVPVQVAWLALLVLCLEACLCLGAAPRSVGAGTYCGSRLSDALRLMCNGRYNSYFRKSQGQLNRYQRTRRELEENLAPQMPLPFRDRLRAAALLESRPRDTRVRVTRGVFDECCTKSCSIDELMNYCDVSDD